MNEKQTVDTCSRRYTELLEKRSNWEATWNDVATYLLPRNTFSDPDAVDHDGARTVEICDSTATRALQKLASGVHSSLTSPARDWFHISTDNAEVNDDSSARKWCSDTEGVMYHALSHSNAYDVLHQSYIDLIAFGQTVILCEEGNNGQLRLHMIPITQYALSQNADGEIDTLYRRFQLQHQQIVAKYKKYNGLPKDFEDSMTDPFALYTVIQMIEPNPNYDKDKPGFDKKFNNFTFLESGNDNKFLCRLGYDEQPFFAPRWSVIGDDIYGYSPGVFILPDVKLLQALVDSFCKAAELGVNPALLIPAEMKNTVHMYPGGLTMYSGNSPERIRNLYEVRVDMVSVQGMIQMIREQIKESLFNDIVSMASFAGRDRVTATEVHAKQTEQMLQLGPVLERLGNELLDPFLRRVYGILYRQGKIPDIPPVILENNVRSEVKYVSALAQAQRSVGLSSIVQLVNFAGTLAQFDRSAVDKLKYDEILTQYGNICGASTDLMRGDKQVAEIRAYREKMQQAQQAQQAQQEQQGQQGQEGQEGQ